MATIRPLDAINTSANNGCRQSEYVQSKASISQAFSAGAATPLHAAPSSTERERLDIAILSISASATTQKQPKQIRAILKSAIRPSRFSKLKCNNSDISCNSENTNASPRSTQRDQILEGIFSFLSLEDRVWAAALTCRRFAFCSNLPGCWRDVDATGFVQRFYDSSLKRALVGSPDRIAKESAEKETSKALIHILSRHKNAIESLSIQNIRDKLSADVAVMGIGPCLTSGKLQNLRFT